MSLLGERTGPVGGDTTGSLLVELLDNHEKGLDSLLREVEVRSGAGGFSGTGGPEDGLVFGGDSVAGGDQGMAGNEFAILLRESFLETCFGGTGGATSVLPDISRLQGCEERKFYGPRLTFLLSCVRGRIVIQTDDIHIGMRHPTRRSRSSTRWANLGLCF